MIAMLLINLIYDINIKKYYSIYRRKYFLDLIDKFSAYEEQFILYETHHLEKGYN